MKFYEVITNPYANKVIAQKDLPDYLSTLWHFLEVKLQISYECVCHFLCSQKDPLQDTTA
jgi:hypothetical protein